jgi:hypothetical protein
VVIAYLATLNTLSSIGVGLTYTYSASSRPGYHVYTFTQGTGPITW